MEKDVVLVVADTLSAFNLPMYGYDRNTAPFMSNLADENILVKKAYSPAPWTVPVHASMFTGEMPDVCGTHSESLFFDSDSIVAEFSDDGYRTIGISNNYLISRALGFDRGFDFFQSDDGIFLESEGLRTLKEVFQKEQDSEYESKFKKYCDFLKRSLRRMDFKSLFSGARLFLGKKFRDDYTLYGDSGSKISNKLAERKLSNVNGNFFLFLNYMEAHQPFRTPGDFDFTYLDDPSEDRQLYLDEVYGNMSSLRGKEVDQDLIDVSRDFYDTTIRYLDSRIENLYDIVSENSDDFLFVIVGDHGEMLGERNMWGHQHGIWEELIRVPVIVAGPGVDKEQVVEGNFSLKDIYNVLKGQHPGDLTSDRVFSQYRGVEGFARQFGEGLPNDQLESYSLNKSQAVVFNDEIYTNNSHLPNLRYSVNNMGKGNIEEFEGVHKSIKLRFGEDLDDLEF